MTTPAGSSGDLVTGLAPEARPGAASHALGHTPFAFPTYGLATVTLDVVDPFAVARDTFAAWARATVGVSLTASVASADLLGDPPASVVVVGLSGDADVATVTALAVAGRRVVALVSLDAGEVTAGERLRRLQAAGAVGLATQVDGDDGFLAVLRRAAGGEQAWGPGVVEALASCATERPSLSDKERMVLVHYVGGLTLDSAARRCGIKPGTAKVYLDRVKEKYEAVGRPARTKLELAERVHQDGWTL